LDPKILPSTVLNYTMWVLSPQHGASLDCGWRREPLDMESACKYIE